MPKRGQSPESQAISAAMRRVSMARTAENRALAFRELAGLFNSNGRAESFLSKVLSRQDANARRFALELAARLRPLPNLVIPSLVNLLGKSKYPSRLRIAVAANVINHLPENSPTIPQVLSALERKTQPLKAAERLNRLLEQIPRNETILKRRQELLESARSVCPRCQIRLTHADFVTHLWEVHQLRLEAGRVQEPWQLIENWVNQYRNTQQGELLERASELAQLLDPLRGMARIHHLLSSPIGHGEEHMTLRAIATERHASVCPHCYEILPFPDETKAVPLLLAGGVLSGANVRFELRDRFLFNWLSAEWKTHKLDDGPEPGHPLTRRGVVSLFVMPLVLFALLFAVLPPIAGTQQIYPVCVSLLLACFCYFGIRFHWDHAPPLSHRIINHAWKILVPQMNQIQDLSTDDQLILAGLCLASINHGDTDDRATQLKRAMQLAGEHDWNDAVMAALMLLKHEDRDETADDVALLAVAFADVCTGRASWGAANRLFERVRGDLADRTRRARLRIFLLRTAYEAGLDPGDLRLLGRLAPEVGTCYASEDREGLARLRLLWIYRANRLWQQVGAAASVFDLAQYAQSYLEQRPDLLLLQPAPNAEESPILICEEGIVYRDSILTSMEDRLTVRAKSGSDGGFDLLINSQRYSFRKEPKSLLNRLKSWRRFLFEEFLPRAELLQDKRSELGDLLLNRHRRTCSACQKSFVGLPGEMGFVIENSEEDET